MRVLVPKSDTANLCDPSQAYRPEHKDGNKDKKIHKKTEQFRNYTVEHAGACIFKAVTGAKEDATVGHTYAIRCCYKYESELEKGKEQWPFSTSQDNLQTEVVRGVYKDMHVNQTVAFVKEKRDKWLKFNHAEMSIMEAVTLLDDLVDKSDPDIDLPNSVHAFQTAERIREKHPDQGWFQLIGLIHDLGKVMSLWGEAQWCVVGDSFPVGCQFQNSCVFPEYFKDNADYNNANYSTANGIYKQNCGLENITMSWGHDEYMYQLLRHNKTSLPEEGLYMVRYHSFYPYHTGGSYRNLSNKKDEEMLPWILEFNSFDLYSKSDEIPDIKGIKPYYQSLIDKYIPGILKW